MKSREEGVSKCKDCNTGKILINQLFTKLRIIYQVNKDSVLQINS